jgi:hypothetical protein
MLPEEEPGDHEAGDDKEDIHSNESTGQSWDTCVEEDD